MRACLLILLLGVAGLPASAKTVSYAQSFALGYAYTALLDCSFEGTKEFEDLYDKDQDRKGIQDGIDQFKAAVKTKGLEQACAEAKAKYGAANAKLKLIEQ